MRFKYYLRGAGIGVIVATLILAVAFLFQDNISDEEVIRRAIKLGMVMEENTPGTLADFPQSKATAVDLEGADGSSADGNASNTDAAGNPQSGGENPDGQPGTDSTDPDGTDSDPLNPDNTSDSQTDPDSGKTPNNKSDDEKSNDEKSNDEKSDENKSGTKKSDTETDKKKDSAKNPDKSEHPSDPSSSENGKTDPDADSPDKGSTDGQSNEVEIVIEAGDVSRMVSAKVFEAGLVDSADEFNSYLGAHGYDNMLQPGTYKITKGSSFRQIAKILTTR